jgi:hypothetical protein
MHLELKSNNKEHIVNTLAGLLTQKLPPDYLYLASFSLNADGIYGMTVNVGGPEPL